MFTLPEEMSAYQRASLDGTLKLADAAAASTEQWFNLNLQSAKAGSTELLRQARALAAAKDVQELASLQTSFAQANAEKAAGYARALYGWMTEAQAELSRALDAQIAEANRALATAVDKAAKSAPGGSEFAFAAFKQAMSAGNQAYDAMTKAGKQVADMTEATVSSANVAGTGKKKVL
jgi:phasin family protein